MKCYGFADLWKFQGFVVEEVRNEEGGDVHVSLRLDERCVLKWGAVKVEPDSIFLRILDGVITFSIITEVY